MLMIKMWAPSNTEFFPDLTKEPFNLVTNLSYLLNGKGHRRKTNLSLSLYELRELLHDSRTCGKSRETSDTHGPYVAIHVEFQTAR